MVVGIPKESYPGERRVSATPVTVAKFRRAGFEVMIEPKAGEGAGFTDTAYEEVGARLLDRRALFSRADILLFVRAGGANPEVGLQDLPLARPDQVWIGFFNPLGDRTWIRRLAEAGVVAFALELLPRIARAQSMDALSSMATVAGYKAVLLAAERLSKFFPMLMTAAGTIFPAKVFVLGAGVAGLQAIATARRLGAVVEAYDVRPAVKEQVESLGAKFVELPLEVREAEDASGYAREQTEEFYKKQQELLFEHVREADVVITTALVPGRRAPLLVTEEMVYAMRPGSVVVDLAAEQGGNCALTVPGEAVECGGVTILGPLNLPSTLPADASRMYANNIASFLLNLYREGRLALDADDEIIRSTLLTRGGEIVHPSFTKGGK